MLSFELLNKFNIKNIKKYSIESKKFNSLNKSFLQKYYKSNFFQKIFLRRKALILKMDTEIIGFIWCNSFRDAICYIEELYILPKKKLDDSDKVSNIFSPYSKVIYKCIDNVYNEQVLSKLGFHKKYAIIEMELYIEDYKIDFNKHNNDELKVEILKEGVHEEIRCNLQNRIFKSSDRVDLKVADIYEDEKQEYYIKNGAILLKYKDEYIGYSQIIKENGFITIVNLGIVSNYRGIGMGKILLNEIIKLIKIMYPYEKIIKIKVYKNNIAAFNLYKKIGFTEKKTVSLWEIKNKI